MTAMLPSSWRSPAAGGRVFRRSICARLSSIRRGVFLDAGDPHGAGNRRDVVALREQPGQRDLRRFRSRLRRTMRRLRWKFSLVKRGLGKSRQ